MSKKVVYSAALWAGVVSAMSSTAWAADDAALARGKALFTAEAVPACAICHALADAGAEGAIGPDLDELKPGKDVILKVLNEGMGAMPSFAETMNEADQHAVADYIVSVTAQ